MSQDLIVLTVVMVFTGFGVFLGYWSGVSKAEAAAEARIEHLLDELDEACATITDILETSAISRHPSGRSLSLVKDTAARQHRDRVAIVRHRAMIRVLGK